MVKIDFAEVVKAGKTPKPVILTLIVNWCIKPFTMLAIAWLFLGIFFKGWLPGVEIVKGGAQVELFRSYIAGCILLGIAPCTAMVLIWGHLARGNDGHTLVMVAINSLTMLFLYAPLGGWLLGINKMPIPWQTIVLSVIIYVGLPLLLGYYSRKWLIARKGLKWFEEKFLRYLTPVSISALLLTLVLLFSFKGELIINQPQVILLIAVPLFIQTCIIFAITYIAAKRLKLSYRDAAPSALVGASNHFEVAIATSTILFGLSSGASLATVVGVLIEVPVMLLLVRVCLRTRNLFDKVRL
jgi:ACR3 family arsenite transporter